MAHGRILRNGPTYMFEKNTFDSRISNRGCVCFTNEFLRDDANFSHSLRLT